MRKHRRNRVLLVVENWAFPTDKRVSKEAYSLQKAGFIVSVISPKGRNYDRKWFERHKHIDVYRYPLPFGVKSFLGYFLEFSLAWLFIFGYSLFVCFSKGFDIIHFANPPDIFFTIGMFYRMFGKKTVFDQHDLSPESYIFKAKHRVNRLVYRLLLLAERLSYRIADAVVVANLSFKQIAISRGGIDSNKLVVVRNGFDPQNLSQLQISDVLKKGRLFLVGYVGMTNFQDGVEFFLRAIDYIVNKRGRRDIQFAVVGDGDAISYLKNLAVESHISDFVDFTGWVEGEELHSYLSSMDVGVSPEPHNLINDVSTLMKVIEYMSYGKPVVAFRLKETMYTAGRAALYAVPNDASDLASRIIHLIDNPSARKNLGTLGHRRVLEMFSWEHQEKKLLKMYGDLICANDK